MKTRDKASKKNGKIKHVKVKSMTNITDKHISDKLYAHLCTVERAKKTSRNSQQKLMDYINYPTEVNKPRNKKIFAIKTIEIAKPKPIKNKTEREGKVIIRKANLNQSASTMNNMYFNHRYKKGRNDRSHNSTKNESCKSYKNFVNKKIYFYDKEGDLSEYIDSNKMKKIRNNLEVAYKDSDRDNNDYYDNHKSYYSNKKNNYNNIYFGVDDDIEEEIDRVFSKGHPTEKKNEKNLIKHKKKPEKKVEKKVEKQPEKKAVKNVEKEKERENVNKSPSSKATKNKKDKKDDKTEANKDGVDNDKSRNKSKKTEIKWPSELGNIPMTKSKQELSYSKEKEKEKRKEREEEEEENL